MTYAFIVHMSFIISVLIPVCQTVEQGVIFPNKMTSLFGGPLPDKKRPRVGPENGRVFGQMGVVAGGVRYGERYWVKWLRMKRAPFS